MGARILKVALDFDTLQVHYGSKRRSDNPVADALARMRDRSGWYDPEVLDALESLATLPDGYQPRLMPTEELTAGMLLDQDVADLGGNLALGRGLELNAVAIRRLARLDADRGTKGRWRVLTPPPEQLAFAMMLDG